MSKTMLAVGAVVLVAGGAAFYLQTNAVNALRREMAGLREEVRQAARIAKAQTAGATQLPERAGSSVPTTASPVVNEDLTKLREEVRQAARMAKAHTAGATQVPATAGSSVPTTASLVGNEDLTKLREEVVALRKSATALTQFVQVAQAAQDLARTSEAVATNLIPAAQLRNSGRATPEASTETALWAAVGGDVDTLASTVTFTPSAKAKADAWFAGLSDTTRQQYGSPDKVIALMVAKDAAALSGMQVLGQKELGPDDVGVRLRLASNDGKTKDDTVLMHRTTDGWKLLLNDSAVERFARQVKGGR